MASSHDHHAHSISPLPPAFKRALKLKSYPGSHMPSNDFRLLSLPQEPQFPAHPPQQHNEPPAPDQPPSGYAGSNHRHALRSTNGMSFSAFGYPTPTPTSTTSPSAYVHRQFVFQGQTSTQIQQQHPHGANQPASAHSHTMTQMHVQVPPSQMSSPSRTTPLVLTTVNPHSTATPHAPSAFTASLPKYCSISTSAPYPPYNRDTSPANITSPTFLPLPPHLTLLPRLMLTPHTHLTRISNPYLCLSTTTSFPHSNTDSATPTAPARTLTSLHSPSYFRLRI
ncbi:hypothetical protein OG21DRAFT_1498236 [Imleria badia]|nr:hypothetical protein OG21DRAFT_1498236 [Imleria badia]